MNNKDIANEWFAYADNDLTSARFLLKMHPTPLEIICYHCQQSAEKNLKGFVALFGGSAIKTHDLIVLNKECIKYDNDFCEIEDDCIELIDYGVQVRYPFYVNIEMSDVKKAIKSAEKICEFIKEKVKK